MDQQPVSVLKGTSKFLALTSPYKDYKSNIQAAKQTFKQYRYLKQTMLNGRFQQPEKNYESVEKQRVE